MRSPAVVVLIVAAVLTIGSFSWTTWLALRSGSPWVLRLGGLVSSCALVCVIAGLLGVRSAMSSLVDVAPDARARALADGTGRAYFAALAAMVLVLLAYVGLGYASWRHRPTDRA